MLRTRELGPLHIREGGTDGNSPLSARIALGLGGSRYVSELATGGIGTSGSPWTGWETPLQTAMTAGVIDWRFNNRFDGTRGYFGTSGGLSVANIVNLKIRSDAGATIAYTGGAGSVIAFTSSGVANNTTVHDIELPIIAGNGSATSCVDITGCNHGKYVIRGYGATNLLALHAGVCSKFWLHGSVNIDPSPVAHTALIDTATTDCDFYCISEGNPGAGLKLDDCVGSTFYGTSEGNTGGSGYGITFGSDSDRNVFIGMDLEANAGDDLVVTSSWNTFLNCISTGTVTVSGIYGNVFQGGSYKSMVFSTGGHTIRDLGFNPTGGGSITGAGLAACCVQNVRDIFGVAWLPDQLPHYTPSGSVSLERCQIVRATNLSVPDFVTNSSAWTTVPLTVAGYDDAGMWDSGTPNDIVIPTTGEYDIEFWGLFQVQATGVAGVRFTLNGATSQINEAIIPAGVVIASAGTCTSQGNVFTAGDILTVQVMQSSGSSINLGLAVVTVTRRA